MFSYVSTSLAYYRMRTSRAWEVHIPSSASSILPPPSVPPLPSRTQYPKGLASAHACETAWEWLFV